jgi:hypothetical protein
MKTVLLFTCVITLLTSTGCFFPGRGGGGGGHWHDRGDANVAPSEVAMNAPELMVAPLVAAEPAPEFFVAPSADTLRVASVIVP